MDWTGLVREFGPVLTILLFFIWRDYKREQSMTSRIRSIEDYQRNRLEKLIEASTAALIENTESNRSITKALEQRPCLVGHELHA